MIEPTKTAVVAGIIKIDGKYLIAKRFNNTHLGGIWEFPGGKIMQGESDIAALRRELKEEIGVECSVGELIYQTGYEYPDINIHIKFFECSISSGVPKPLECASVRWIKPSELMLYEFPPSDIKLIKKLSID